jgi:hypothetical protein
MSIFTALFAKQSGSKDFEQRVRRDLLRREAAIGKTIFGPVPKGHNREFFRIDAKTWIWQETWLEKNKRVTRETKYVIRERDIIKSVNGGAYQKTSLEEAENLHTAIQTYATRVKKELYQV